MCCYVFPSRAGQYQDNGPFSQCQKIKMAAIVWGLCMEGLQRGWCFAIIGMKKLQDIFE